MTCTLLTTVQISQILVLSQNLKQTNVCIIQVNVCEIKWHRNKNPKNINVYSNKSQKLLSFRFVQQNKLHVFILQIRQRMNVINITNITIIKDEVLLMVSCPIFPSILIAKNLLTGSLKNTSIDNLEMQKKSISMKNSQFFDYLLYAKSK